MKKLLVLLISLCLVTNALAVIEFSLQQETTGAHEVFNVDESDIIWIDIYAKNMVGGTVDLMNTGQIDIAITGPATFAGTTVDQVTYGNTWWPMMAPTYQIMNYTSATTLQATFGYLPSSHTAALDLALDAIVIDHIGIHCEGPGLVTVAITAAGDDPYGDAVYWDGSQIVVDTASTVGAAVTIHQTPEPMTIALLGLGGLFLRRRK
jgi:hypothetical protein